MKILPKIFEDGIKAEKEAINYYTFLYPFIPDGNDRRSIMHILKEEQDHLSILQKIASKHIIKIPCGLEGIAKESERFVSEQARMKDILKGIRGKRR